MARKAQRRRLALMLLAGACLVISAWLGAAPLPAASVVKPPVTPEAMGGGEFTFGLGDELSAAAEAAILAEIAQNQARLYRAGKLATPRAGAVVSLAWPLRPAAGFSDFSYYGVSNFVDNDLAFPNRLRDFTNGDRTYDTANGYNHSGTDFFLWPFGWLKMQENSVEVVAAADGVIVGKQDGNDDHNCGFTTSSWNAVYVQHEDGTLAWYGHLKRDSLTTKAIGSPVTVGEYLGLVGSSGFSTAPHLHLELRTGGGRDSQTIDPYFGPGNPTLPQSLWQQQPSYYDSALLHLGTGYAEPVFPHCPEVESPNETDRFERGDHVYLSVYFRDQLQGQLSELEVLRPDGTVHAAWSFASAHPHYAASFWWWRITIPGDADHGEWRFRVMFQGNAHVRSFYVGEPPTATGTPTPTETGTLTPTATPTATATATPSDDQTPPTYPPPVEFDVFQFLPFVTH